MKRSGLSMAAMVATVVMVLTVSTYAITARTVNPVVGLSFQGTTAVCHAKCFAGSDNDNIQATLTLYCGANRLDSWDGSGKGTISLSGTCRVETGKQYKLTLTYSISLEFPVQSINESVKRRFHSGRAVDFNCSHKSHHLQLF